MSQKLPTAKVRDNRILSVNRNVILAVIETLFLVKSKFVHTVTAAEEFSSCEDVHITVAQISCYFTLSTVFGLVLYFKIGCIHSARCSDHRTQCQDYMHIKASLSCENQMVLFRCGQLENFILVTLRGTLLNFYFRHHPKQG